VSVVHRKRFAVRVQELTRHAEVNQESAPTFEPNNQILAAPVKRLYPLSLQFGCYSSGIERSGEPRVEDRHAFEPPADEERLEARADCLDLR
jgi:hypothetical protein